MKMQSFQEILDEKLAKQGLRGTSQELPKEEASFSLGLEAEISALFQAPLEQKAGRSTYVHWPRPAAPPESTREKPREVSDQKLSTPVPTKTEFWITKDSLNFEERNLWSLFELYVEADFEGKVTPELVNKAFRKFVKNNHPDFHPEKEACDFSEITQIKDEFLQILKKRVQ